MKFDLDFSARQLPQFDTYLHRIESTRAEMEIVRLSSRCVGELEMPVRISRPGREDPRWGTDAVPLLERCGLFANLHDNAGDGCAGWISHDPSQVP